MKKHSRILLSLFFCLGIIIFSCNKNTQVKQILNQNVPKGSNGETIVENSNQLNQGELSSNLQTLDQNELQKIDIDLSKMSATMIYSEVFNMMLSPEEYENKIIKVKGTFQVYTNPAETEQYFAVIVQDATACCQQGIEFIWEGTHTYPDDYPQIGQEITVIGKYIVTTLEDELSYAFLQINEWN